MRSALTFRSAETAEFTQLAKALALGRGSLFEAETHAQHCGFPRVAELVKTAAAAGTTTTLPELVSYDNLQVAFIRSLQNAGAFDAVLPFTPTLPLLKPAAVVTSVIEGDEVGEGAATPIHEIALTNGGLAVRKAIAEVVLSEDLLRVADQSLFSDELRAGVALATDRIFVSDLATAPASVNASGTNAEDVLADLAAAAVQMNLAETSRLFLLCDVETVARLALASGVAGRAFPDVTLNGGDLGGITVVPTRAITASSSGAELYLVDAAQIAADTQTVILEGSRHGTVQMSTTPDDPANASSVLVNLWQHNLVALRAKRFFGFQRLRDTAVVRIEGAHYVGGAS